MTLSPTTRRRVLQGLGALPFAVLLPYSKPTLTRGASLLMACADPAPGVVTGETGTDFADAFSEKDGVAFQYQLWLECSTFTGAAARYRLNQRKQNEVWLLLGLVCAHVNDPTNQTPVPYRTGVYVIGQDVYTEGGPGVTPNTVYSPFANWVAHNGNCHQSTQAPSGSFTLTVADDLALEGSYDLLVGGQAKTGTFVAPRVPWAGCPPRPSKPTCVS